MLTADTPGTPTADTPGTLTAARRRQGASRILTPRVGPAQVGVSYGRGHKNFDIIFETKILILFFLDVRLYLTGLV